MKLHLIRYVSIAVRKVYSHIGVIYVRQLIEKDIVTVNSVIVSFLYQDKLIQCDIQRVAEHADFNLWRRTCRMITVELVLPNEPTVTGYPSYNPCHPASTTPTPAA